MKRCLLLLLAAAMLLSLTACGQKAEPETQEDLPLSGGWQRPENNEISPEARAAFDKAMENLTGVDYEPKSLLGTQVVAGMNYCFLCKATVVYPGAEPYDALVYIYADLQGNAEITDIVNLSEENAQES